MSTTRTPDTPDTSGTRGRSWPLRALALTAVLALVAAAATYAVASGSRPPGEPYSPPSASKEQLEEAKDLRVFFAHQSVGRDILAGLPDVYEAQGLTAPDVVDVADAGAQDRLVHANVGENGDPMGKIEEFDRLVRGGLGDSRDVAMLKLCYTDIRSDTDVEAVFTAYRDTVAALQADYPDVDFVAATVPLTIRRSAVGTIKEWVGRGDRYGPEHNLARERFNTLMRAEYGDEDRLFDVAAVQSTDADGRRETGSYDGQTYYSLDRSLAKDPGHPNEAGAAASASAMLSLFSKVSGSR